MPPIAIKPLSDSDAAKAAKPSLWKGWFLAEFIEASETESKRNNAMIAAILAVFNGAEQREFRDWYTASERSAAKVRHAYEAVGKLAKYDAGLIAAEDFPPGQRVQVRLDVEKGHGGFPARSVIVDYKAAASEVVNLRQAG
jgi:hypothetical protein